MTSPHCKKQQFTMISFSLSVIFLGLVSFPTTVHMQTIINIHSMNTCNTSSMNYSSSGGCSLTLDSVLEGMLSNTTVYLSPGNYTVRTNYSVENKSDVKIVGVPDDPGSVIIECDDSFGLVFISVQRLHISGLTVRDCGFKDKKQVQDIFAYVKSFIFLYFDPLSDFSTGILMVDCQDTIMYNVSIKENEGFGLVGINLIGTTKFSRVNLTKNHPSMCILDEKDILSPGGTGGGLFLLYQDYLDIELNKLSENSTFSFDEGHITQNYNCRPDLFTTQFNKLSRSLDPTFAQNNSIIGSGGMTITLGQSLYGVNSTISWCNFTENSGLYHSAGMQVTQFRITKNSHVHIVNTLFYMNGGLINRLNNLADEDVLDPFGAIVTAFYTPSPLDMVDSELHSEPQLQTENTVLIQECVFERNRAKSGAGISVISFGPLDSFIGDKITICRCLFDSNEADYGGAIYVTEISYSAFESGLIVVMDSIKVENNSMLSTSLSSSFQSVGTGVVDINYVNVSFIGENIFLKNQQTAISGYSAILTISGKNFFCNNVGSLGGALHLNTESYVVLTDTFANFTTLVFLNNTALIYGGAIYVNLGTIRANTYDCFIFLDRIDIFCNAFNRCTLPNNRFLIVFDGNIAPFGSALYGSTVNECPWNTQDNINMIEFSDIANQSLSHLDPTRLPVIFSSLVELNTTVNTVAFEVKTYSEDSMEFSNTFSVIVTPGKEFFVLLGAFDRLEQSVPLTIFSQLGNINVSVAYSKIGASNRFLLPGGYQNALSYVPVRVFGSEGSNYTVTITSNEATVEFYIYVSLFNCSEGFKFNEETLSCDCEILKFIQGVTCNENGTVSYEEDNWIGIDEEGNYIKAPCILDFCQPGLSTINFSQRDDQCRNNHSGILCGQCSDGNSRIIGGNFCDVCDNNYYLFLIILFAVMGILLFAILAVFNITITDGFVNGFIFYANINSVYISTFFPVTELRGSFPQVLISFLNLNFGIKTCFYDGLTELDLVGLTLLFPVYLMLILFAVILFGKYVTRKRVSSFLQKINFTHIFATLFLYSYSSLLETCVTILAFININGASPSLRWRRDPNVAYSPGTHLFLVVMSALIVIVLFPLPIILLTPQLSFRIPFVHKLKPLIDAFIAPFAVGKAFWVSFRLLFRLLIYVIAAADASLTQLVVMSVLITSLTIWQAYLKPYKTISRNVVDISLMFNLSLFSIVSVFLFQKPLSQEQKRMDILFVFTYTFSIMLFIMFLHYILTRFTCTRTPYERAILWIREQIRLVGNYLSNPTKFWLKKKNMDVYFSNDINLRTSVTHTSVSLSVGHEDTTYITLREVLLEDETNIRKSRNSSSQSENSTS